MFRKDVGGDKRMMPILTTKLSIPPLRSNVVSRSHLIERLNEGLHRKLILVSAPVGFGKTTLLSEWVQGIKQPVAWLSLDQRDNDITRFLMYLVAAMQTITTTIGEGVLNALLSPQPPPLEALLTTLLNDLTTIKDPCVLVLDDYHMIDTEPVDQTLNHLITHLPAQMCLVIATREDPRLPLARLRARNQLTELRAIHLRFSPSEASAFLSQIMGLTLSATDITILEQRTEGWIAGLQLAALSLQGHDNATGFIASFTGNHHFVLDYLMEEVLGQLSEPIQSFLLRTSILDRISGPLCDAVMLDSTINGQATLEYLERANLFLVPLDHERNWYRYHHLFADLLKLRLRQSLATVSEDATNQMNTLHTRASTWYEEQGLLMEAFHHATAAKDVKHAERLIDDRGLPLHFRGAVTIMLQWLESLPETVLNARPSLWMRYAELLVVNGQTTGVEEKLQAAENAIPHTEADALTRDQIGQIANVRATLALTRYQIETMLAQSHRALEYLDPDNLPFRAMAYWTQGFASQLQGDRSNARRVYSEAIVLSQAAGDIFTTILATIGLGQIQEADNQLVLAAQTYRHVLQIAGNHPLQIVYEAHLGLARILYEWNCLDDAMQHGQQSLHLAQQYDHVIDRFIVCKLFLVRLKLAQDDIAGAEASLAEIDQSVRRHNFVHRFLEVAAAQVQLLLRQDKVVAATHLVQAYELPLSRARVQLAQGDPVAALAALSFWQQQVETRGWKDEELKVMVLQAITLLAHGEEDQAVHLLTRALTIAEPAGFMRLFLDEGRPIAHLLSSIMTTGKMTSYIEKMLSAFQADLPKHEDTPSQIPAQQYLSQRELEVLHLMAQGLSNQDISKQLFVALSTVKGHIQKIFGKLQVQRRTEAIARARQLDLL